MSIKQVLRIIWARKWLVLALLVVVSTAGTVITLLLPKQYTADTALIVENGDIVYVDRAPSAYIYGEIQRPGMFRLERGMTLMQALAQSGGLTARGTQRGIKVHRRDANGVLSVTDLDLNDPVVRDDVIYVKESLF